MKSIFVFMFFILGFMNQAFSQSLESREKAVFNRGIEFYKNNQFKEAENSFKLVVTRLPNSRYITAYYLMLAKAQYKLNNYSGSIKTAKMFLNQYPTSSYVDDVFALQGDCFYRLKRFDTAIKTWHEAINYSNDNRLKKLLKKKIINTLVKYHSISEIEKLKSTARNSNTALALEIAFYIKNYKKQNKEKNKVQLQESISNHSKSDFVDDAEELLSNKKIIRSNSIKIALLLPFSGFNEKIGKEIKEGVDIAVEKFNSTSNVKLEILLNDYGENITDVLIKFKQISANQDILCVYGPIENDFTAACAAISEYEQLPTFSPTASENNLTKLSPYFYQLNNTTKIQASAISKFATDSLGIKRFATFAPIENQFVSLVNKFVESCESNAAEVVTQEWYYPGEQDFYKKFMKLKRKGLKLAFTDSVLLDNPEYSQTMIDSLYKIYLIDEQEKAEENFVKIDSADIPVTTIGGLFVPIYQEDLQFIAPQIAYSNIQAQVFGNSDWYNSDELKKNKNYIDGIIFASDGYLNEEDWNFRKFRNTFRDKLKKSPTKYNIIGYDTFSYILRYLKNLDSPINRDEFFELLKNKIAFDGVYKSIHLNKQNINNELKLIKYKFGQFLPVN